MKGFEPGTLFRTTLPLPILNILNLAYNTIDCPFCTTPSTSTPPPLNTQTCGKSPGVADPIQFDFSSGILKTLRISETNLK